MTFASWDPLRGPFGTILVRLGSLLGRLEAILAVLERSSAVSGSSWTVLGASLDPLGLSGRALASREVTRHHASDLKSQASSFRKSETWGSGPLEELLQHSIQRTPRT